MAPNRPRRVLQGLGALLALACAGSTDICACPPSIIGSYVAGTVLRADSSPAASARLYPASAPGTCPTVDTLHAANLADSLGHFEFFVGPLSISTDSLCLTLIALPAYTDTASGASLITQTWLQIHIYPSDPLDTAQVTLALTP
jgi:hypothetical protein